ncbi:MAG: tRNA uridine-5-carboxymethylaminomethyl(34) synthesis GTPase MnmE, partial [Paracoccaceae bacterium]
GEDIVELACHGSLAVVSAVLAACCKQPSVRMAEPGEFTRRALENGRLDMTQVEGLADLIDAETEAQRRQALRVLSGELGQRAAQWRLDLVRACALLEATIDFADEEVPVDVTPEVRNLVKATRAALILEAGGVAMAERVRAGFEVAIVGKPNVGKSTLLNALAGREAALTSDVAGTTRDIIEVRMDLDGFAVTLLDTAGLRNTSDHIEELGVERALARANAADIRAVLSLDGAVPAGIEMTPDDIVLLAKCDEGDEKFGISGRTGAGIDRFVDHLKAVLKEKTSTLGVATRERHRHALQEAVVAMDQALLLLESGPDVYELAAEELHRACRAMDGLIGRIGIESILDEIFSSFCLGK